MDFGFVTVPFISLMCYFLGMIIKTTPLDSRYIPILCGMFGALLGALSFFAMPEIIGGDLFTSIAVGLSSGLAATGVHQVSVQLSEKRS
ncbi:MAG: phage holin family protein [Peptococcaceae bacterium]|nr:phage holin family protein [Peptococcaceae bacterium]